MNFVLDLSGIYDVENSKFAPVANIWFDSVISSSDKMPTVSFSFASGKAPAKFEHFDDRYVEFPCFAFLN